MRVTLVHPAGHNFVPGRPDITLLVNRMAPVGILQLAAWLDRFGHTTFVHDCLGPRASGNVEQTAQSIIAHRPDLVGFSVTTSAFLDAYDLTMAIRKLAPGVKVVFGGPHVSSVGAPLLRHFEEIDYLCVGEGEGALEDLAAGKPLKEIRNLAFRDGDRVVTNARRGPIPSLDDLPFPAYEKLEGFPRQYHLPLFSYIKRHGATLITSRGCPYTCSYCDRTVFQRLYRSNSAGYVWEHMRHLRDRWGVHHINFYDDLFTAQRERIVNLCEMLIRRPLGMDFNCAIRAGQSDDELLGLLKRAGCLQVSLGVESADPGMMERHKPGVDLATVKETVRKVQAHGLRAKGLFIFGLPGESPETIRATSDFVAETGFDDLNYTKFTPFYGAPIWEECAREREGRFREDWRLMNCLNFTYIPRGFRSKAEMDRFYDFYVQRFYRSRLYGRRFLRRFWQHRWSLARVLGNLPSFLRAPMQFSPKADQLEKGSEWPPLDPRQPQRLGAFKTAGENGPDSSQIQPNPC